jgi:hypothetical protein
MQTQSAHHIRSIKRAGALRAIVGISALIGVFGGLVHAATPPLTKTALPTKITSYVYSAKFVCGGIDRLNDEQSDVDPVLSPYEDFEPGRYATAFNFLNTGAGPRNIAVYAVAEKLAGPVQVDILALGAFATRRIGCMDIMQDISASYNGNPLDGQLFEGFVYFVQTSDQVEVEAVYSYAYEADDGFLFDGIQSKGGLGASLDVVKVVPREVDGPLLIPLPLATGG